MNNKATLFYDASCPLCKSEIEMIKLHDNKQQFTYIDCSSTGFDDAAYRIHGYTQQGMMEQLHLKDHNGEWFIGIDAFQYIYQTIDMQALAYLWGGKLTRPLTKVFYPWIAKNRQLLSFVGLPFLFQMIGTCAAKRALKKSRQCTDGQCTDGQCDI